MGQIWKKKGRVNSNHPASQVQLNCHWLWSNITQSASQLACITQCLSEHFCWTSLVAQTVKCLSTMWETWVQSLGWEDSLEKEMATHSSTLALKILWMEELGAGYCPWGRKELGMTERLHFLSFFLQGWKNTVMGTESDKVCKKWTMRKEFCIWLGLRLK